MSVPNNGGIANVMNYGATGLGIVNDTVAFNAALSVNDTVYVPAGTYLINSLSNLRSNHTLYGDGDTSILKQIASAPVGSCMIDIRHTNNGGTSSIDDNYHDIILKNLQMRGYADAPVFEEHTHLVAISACSDVIFDSIFFYAWKGDAIYIGSGVSGIEPRHNTDITVKNCRFDGSNKENRNAISIIDCDRFTCRNSFFTRCTKANQPGAIDFEPNNLNQIIKDGIVSDNNFYDIGGNVGAISAYMKDVDYIQRASGLSITNNTIDICTAVGVSIIINQVTELTNVNNITITGNKISNTNKGIDVLSGNKVIIENNTILDSPYTSHVGFTSADRLCIDTSIKSNTFTRCGTTAGKALAIFNVINCIIDSNTFISCGTGVPANSMAIQFGVTSESKAVSIINNNIVSNGITLSSLQKEATHTTTSSLNTKKNNSFENLTDNYPADIV